MECEHCTRFEAKLRDIVSDSGEEMDPIFDIVWGFELRCFFKSFIMYQLCSGVEYDEIQETVELSSRLAMVYISRLASKYRLNSANVHTLFYIAFHVANKMLDDCYTSNKPMVYALELRVSDVGYLESSFLLLMGFALHVDVLTDK